MLKSISRRDPKLNSEQDGAAETLAAENPALWSGKTAVVVVVVTYLFALYAGGVILSAYAGLHHWTAAYTSSWINNSVFAQFLYVLVDEALTVALLWAFIHFRHYKGARKALGLLPPRLRDFRYVLSGTAAYFILYVLAINIAVMYTHINTNQQQDVGFQVISGHGALLLTFLSLVLLPPLVEETIFRGFLFSGLRRRFKFVGAALLVSGLFAIPHLLEGNGGGLLWTAGIDTFILSMVLCYVREKTGHIWPGMIIHGFKNFVAFYVLFLHH